MGKTIRLTAVQPPHPYSEKSTLRTPDILEVALELIDEAGILGSDIALLPELINVFDTVEVDVAAMAGPQLPPLLEKVSARAKMHNMYIIFPVAEMRDDGLYNTAIIFGRDGAQVGRYDKTHISQAEYNLYPSIKAGNNLPTFDLDFGRIGIMTCYDCYFPEVAVVYSLKGADVLFYPRWQSGPSEISFEIQMRDRAIDHAVVLVTSSFGVEPDVAWKPGYLLGRSCVVGRDGTILADAGHAVGLASAVVEFDKPRLIECLDECMGEGLVRDLRELILHDRRPELYTLISRPKGGGTSRNELTTGSCSLSWVESASADNGT